MAKVKLPKLDYSYSALEPYIDRKTMLIHHTKHHQAYIDNFNNAMSNASKLSKLSVEEVLGNVDAVPKQIRQTVINNAGGHANHAFFWKIMGPAKLVKDYKPSGTFASAVDSTFGSMKSFTDAFSEKAMGVFGSGWSFLVVNKKGKLELTRHSFQNSPLMYSNTPILGIDVWEHAYYLKYQNRRTDYIKAWWNVVNWLQVEKNFKRAVVR